jgi:branched-chain amino acid transport system permease protein
MRRASTPVLLGLALTALTLLVDTTESALPLIYVLLTVALYVFVGNSGLISFGHVGFMAIGAYAGALLTIPALTKELILPDLPGPLADAHLPATAALLVAAAFAALVAYLVSVPLMRLSGLAASIATLSLLVIIQDILNNYDALTGGAGTLTGIPQNASEGTLLAWVLIAVFVAFAYQNSRFGLRLRASREDEVASRAVGIRVERERRIAFTLSAALTAGAGALYAFHVGSLTPSAFYLQVTFLVVAMLVVGGMRSLTGAVAGAVVLAAFSLAFDQLEAGDPLGPISLDLPDGSREILFGAFVLGVLVWRPDGLSGGREVRLGVLTPRWPSGRNHALTKRPLGKSGSST